MPPKSRTGTFELNEATREQLVGVAGLPEAVADAILSRRAQVPSFASLDALRDIAGMTDEMMDNLAKVARLEADLGETIVTTAGESVQRGAAAASDNVRKLADAQAGLVREGTQATERVVRQLAPGKGEAGAAPANAGEQVVRLRTKP